MRDIINPADRVRSLGVISPEADGLRRQGSEMAQKVRTVPARVKLYTKDYVIGGFIHTKPGGYRERVSDILNDSAARFVSLTDAVFRPRHDEDAAEKRVSTLIVNIHDIIMMIPLEGVDEKEGGE